MDEVAITEASTAEGAGLYNVDQIQFGMVHAGGETVWRSTDDVHRWPALIGPDASGWVFSGELSQWSTEGTASEPIVWPAAAGEPSEFLPATIEATSLAEYRVLLAPRRGTFLSIGLSADGQTHLWGVVDSRTVLDEDLGEGFPQWAPSARGFSGALSLGQPASLAMAVHWAEDAWKVHTVRPAGTPFGACVVGSSHLLVSTLGDDASMCREHWLFDATGAATKVLSDLPVINGASYEQGQLTLHANSIGTRTGSQTHLEFHAAPGQAAQWTTTLPGELLLATGRDNAVATLYSDTTIVSFDADGHVTERVDSDPEARGVGHDGELIHVGRAGLERMS